MNARMTGRRGFTLVEMMISLGLMILVIIALLTMVTTTQNTTLTEGRKLDMNQGARVIEQILCEGFRGAGSVLSLANTPTLLGSAEIPFNGVYPLNNSGYPDGVILASGDPDALTRLTADYTAGSATLNVVTVNRADGTVAWQVNDWGMILRPKGYYVFRVMATPAAGDTALTVRDTPAYYSGLLNTAHYNDLSDEQLLGYGNGTYAAGSPVVRLDYFHMYLVRTEADNSLTLTLTSDCEGEADIFGAGKAITDNRAVPILPNVEDIQIEYLTQDPVPLVWAGGDPTYENPCPTGSETGTDCKSFYNQFYTKNIVTARIYVLLRTEEELNKRAGSGITFSKPRMGDTAAAIIPVGRFHYNYMQYEVFIRNFSNVY